MLEIKNREQIDKAITKLEEAIYLLQTIDDEPSADVRQATQIMKYISGSGNTTWKIYDTDLDVMYLRQATLKKLCSQGRINWLNSLDYDEVIEIDWEIRTRPDGDFIKIIEIFGDNDDG